MLSNQEIPLRISGFELSENHLFSRIIDSFQQATKMQARLFPLQGLEEIGSIEGKGHPFCQAIRSCSLGRENCLNEINRAIRMSIKTGEPYIFQCHMDMIEFTAPLFQRRKPLSAFVCGPILLRPLNPLMEKGIVVKAKELSPNDGESLKQTLSEIPVFPERQVQAAADLLFMIANYFSNMDSMSLQREHEINEQQAQLAEKLYISKQQTPAEPTVVLSDLHARGNLYKEKELIELIKMGDRKGAKELLDDLLGTTLFRSHEHIGILKARALEIIFIIARAAVEAGANLEEILGFKYQYVQNLSQDDSQETLYYFLKKAFDQLFECIYQNRNIRHTRLFIKAKEYIWGHYSEEISLKKTALAVGVNSYYLSHLFREEMGISFLDYLTSVRISIAKKLLIQRELSMLQICLEVGYQDPSHFSKVFKKKEGISPTEYRKQSIEQNAD